MAASLGAEVTICAPLGGESGTVLAPLLRSAGLTLREVRSDAANGCYIHDRRTGSRTEIAATRSGSLHRHEIDELFGATLSVGLSSDVTLLTGPRHDDIVPAEIYARLAADLRGNGRTVLADLTGPHLWAALDGGVDLLKMSSEELVREGLAGSEQPAEIVAAVRKLHERGAVDVLVSRASEGALALADERLLEISGPRFSPFDPRGAGDSMFAALGVGFADGLELEAALRLAVAAGALNVTRHGLGSGQRTDIDRLAEAVTIEPLEGVHSA
jgi:1-phosphofructokinase